MISNYIITVLHPKHKLEYFQRAGWPPEWIETAEALVRDEFNQSYVDRTDADDENASSSGESISETHAKVSQLIK